MAKRKDTMTDILEKVEVPSIEEMPLNCLEDYKAYNKEARRLNKKLGVCRYQIKQCPIELHPKQDVILNRVDQPTNPLPVFLVTETIEFQETIIPGKKYSLPVEVIDYLHKKGTPVWKWVTLPNGDQETQISHYEPRFAIRSVM